MELRELTSQLAAYTLWANTLFVDRSKEEGPLLDREVKSSFPTLRLTFLHMRNAEAAWLARVTGAEQKWPAEEDTSIENLLKHTSRLHAHVSAMQDADLLREVEYTDLRGNKHRQVVWQMLLHCFNHSTYHRGQLVTMMRALDMERIPQSDLIVHQRSIRTA